LDILVVLTICTFAFPNHTIFDFQKKEKTTTAVSSCLIKRFGHIETNLRVESIIDISIL